MKTWRSGAFLLVALIWAIVPVVVRGQNIHGRISGTVTDSSGASIGQATLTLTNLDTNTKTQLKTDASGSYSFVNIVPGRYRIQADANGFKKFVREPIVVEVESGLKIDIALPVGTASETVEVTGETPLLQPETNSLGQVIEQRTVARDSQEEANIRLFCDPLGFRSFELTAWLVERQRICMRTSLVRLPGIQKKAFSLSLTCKGGKMSGCVRR